MKLRIHIERLVLEGPLSGADARHVKSGIEQELARLLASGGLHQELRGGAAVPAIAAGALEAPHDASPRQLGQRIARSVHAGIGQAK
jgi:hypothetical protein